MNSSKPNDGKLYKGFLNLKSELPSEAVIYHSACTFASLFFYVLLLFLSTDPLIASCCGAALSIALFLVLFKINNRFYKKDKMILKKLIAVQNLDSVDLLSRFFKDIQKDLGIRSISYFGTALGPNGCDLSSLFSKVFRQQGEELHQCFKEYNGNFFKFVESLSGEQREALFRYYLIE